MSESNKELAWLRRWDASYYEKSVGKWFYGQLKLAASALLFSADKPSSGPTGKPFTLHLEFSDTDCIAKASSSMIFPAITVKTTNNYVHWFSSFQDRNSTFLVIDHFFQASLFFKASSPESAGRVHASDPPHQRTKLGTAILSSVLDSDATLKAAAFNLATQGDQLSGMQHTMHDIQNDLSVAEHITAGLNSWLGRWKVPKATRAEEIILFKDNDIPDVLDVEVLYTKVLSSRVEPQTPGVCRITSEGITILDMKQKVVHHFKWSEVSRLRAVSPWEITVTRFHIGQPDLSYNIVSVHMPRIFRKLTMFAENKIEYLDPPQVLASSERNAQDCAAYAAPPVYSGSSRANASDLSLNSRRRGPQENYLSYNQHNQYQQQTAAVQEEAVISNAEVEELSAALSSIKATALRVGEEQDAQLEVIDDLTSSVTRSNDRIRSMNRTMDKLLK